MQGCHCTDTTEGPEWGADWRTGLLGPGAVQCSAHHAPPGHGQGRCSPHGRSCSRACPRGTDQGLPQSTRGHSGVALRPLWPMPDWSPQLSPVCTPRCHITSSTSASYTVRLLIARKLILNTYGCHQEYPQEAPKSSRSPSDLPNIGSYMPGWQTVDKDWVEYVLGSGVRAKIS